MMKIFPRATFFLALFLFLLSPSTFLAQNKTDLQLVSGTERLPANLQEFINAPIDPAESVDGYYYRFVQFQQLPDVQIRSSIQALGLRLLRYYPENTWLIALPVSFDRSKLSQLQVRSVVAVAPRHKIRPNLMDLPLPSQAVKVPGKVDLLLSGQANLSQQRVRDLLQQQGVEILQNEVHAGVIPVRIPDTGIEDLASLPFVHYLEPVDPQAQPENYTGRTLHRSNVIASDYASGRHYDGEGVVVAMGDDGIIGPHIDYQGRVDNSRVTSNNGNHGDHVAGTIMGAGNLSPKHKGMAFGADLLVYSVWNAVNNGPNHNSQFGVMVTSTSYSNGCNAGYTTFARGADQGVYNTPSLMHVFSAGNDGTSDCGYGAGAGWGNVTGGVKVGKNVIAVANLNFNGQVSNSSSRGPAADGRLKPEVSAKGTSVVSTVEGNAYANYSGTSMACPGVSGTMAQIYHAYRSLNGNQDPPSALIKAILMNTCDDIDNPGPDYRTGFGHINALQAVRTLEEGNYIEDTLDQGNQATHVINVPPGTAQLKVMLYWHDVPASSGANPALVNNLDMTAQNGGGPVYLPWILSTFPNADSLNKFAWRGVDNLNNMEQITIDQPASGAWDIQINGTSIPSGPQGYYLTWQLVDSSITVTYPIGGEGFAPGDREKIRWDTYDDSGVFTIDYSLDSGATWTVLSNNVGAGRRFYDWDVPNGLLSGQALVRVSRGNASGMSDATFSIIEVPDNFHVESACPTYLELAWDSVPGAIGYEVSQLGQKYMDSIGVSTTTNFTVNNIDPNATYWFAVKALGPDGAVGQRTIAIQKGAGIFNCQEPNDIAVAEIQIPGQGIIQTCANTSSVSPKVKLKSYSPNAISNVPVTLDMGNGVVLTDTFTGTVQGFDSVSFTFSTPISLVNGNYTVESWTDLSSDNHRANDSTQANLTVMGGSSATLPFAEDFETQNTCLTISNCGGTICNLVDGWVNAQNAFIDDIDWRVDQAGTPSSDTGPSQDHNPGEVTGRYLYLEATDCFGKEAHLLSPCINLSGMVQPRLSFWFHLYGSDMGELHVDLFSEGEWYKDITAQIISDWTDKWWERDLDLSAWNGQTVYLRFRGITGAGFRSDMALDDIKIYDASVSAEAPLPGQDLSVWPNPSEGIFHLRGEGFNNGISQIRLKDLQGKTLLERSVSINGGKLSTDLDPGQLPRGLYLLEVQNGAQRMLKKVVLQ